MNKVASLPEAIAEVQDGDALVFGGWTIMRTPMGAAYEIIRQGKKGLYLSASATGTISDLLIGAGAIAIAETSWHGHELYGPAYNFRRAVEQGRVNGSTFIHCEETTNSVFLRNYAAAMGLPFFPVFTHKGSDLLNPNYDTLREQRSVNPKLPAHKYQVIKDPFWEGEEVVLLPAARPDVCIIHVHQAGEKGTVLIEGPEYGDFCFAAAAKTTIVTAERIVSEDVLRKHPERNAVPGLFVDAVVELPYGAHPGGCFGVYDTDPSFYEEYVNASKAEESFNLWLEKWVYSVETHEGYLQRLGQEQLNNIQADQEYGYNPALNRRK